jgi:hypothetical protein
MTAMVKRVEKQVARPLKVLVPLIKDELEAADEAGLEHYRQAGEMLNEAKDQVPYGSWARWLTKNFELSQVTARRYMRLARRVNDYDGSTSIPMGSNLKQAIGEKEGKARAAWDTVHHAADRVNVTRLADERQSRDDEIKLHRDIALQLIDLGYRAMATRLHPDRGGSRDAMGRLNLVRDELKSIAAIRRFV